MALTSPLILPFVSSSPISSLPSSQGRTTFITSSSLPPQTIPWAIAGGQRQCGDVQKEASSWSVPDSLHNDPISVQVVVESGGGQVHAALQSPFFSSLETSTAAHMEAPPVTQLDLAASIVS